MRSISPRTRIDLGYYEINFLLRSRIPLAGGREEKGRPIRLSLQMIRYAVNDLSAFLSFLFRLSLIPPAEENSVTDVVFSLLFISRVSQSFIRTARL